MRAVTIREAKAHLNELVEAARRGEQVVLMRGSKHVAALVPLSPDELELPARLSDPQAERLWRKLAEEREEGTSRIFDSPEKAVAFLAPGGGRASSRREKAAAPGKRRRRPA
jgi:prevent-host-death family protein